jgi:hypothetical protein
MAKLTREEAAQIDETFFGINPATFEVGSVQLTRGGTMYMTNPNGTMRRHEPGKYLPKTEVTVVFGLVEVVSVVKGYASNARERAVVEELGKKAAALKAAKEGQP